MEIEGWNLFLATVTSNSPIEYNTKDSREVRGDVVPTHEKCVANRHGSENN